jgi:eukaryotic-like serine/threonine-protein kinase
MATVFLARLSGMAGFQRLYAIKRLHPHLQRETEFVDMFLDEARLAARIHHPHVVPILEIGQSGGYYLVMEYIEGDTAARLFGRCAQHEKRVPWNVGVRIILDTLSGLHAAHEVKDDAGRPLEVVHRDVSPQNVLLAIDGTSRLTDFGVARAASRMATTRSGHLKGKLAYMAPEQARGEAIDRRADVFAAGVMFWELLTFHRLFKSEGEAETLNRLLYLPIPTAREIDPGVPVELEQVVMRALARDPAQRYSSAREMGDALEAAAQRCGMLGTSRDVADLLTAVLGTELDAQREAVRQWMNRSEPNEGRRRSSVPAAPAPRTNPPVSSVSSAVIQVPPPPSSAEAVVGPRASAPPPPPPSPAAQRVRAGSLGALAALVVLGASVGAWQYKKPHAAPRPPALASAAPSPPPAEAPPPADLAAVAAPAPPALPASTLRAAPQDTGAPLTVASSAPRTRAGRPPRGVSRPAPVAAPAPVAPAPAAPPPPPPAPAPAVPDDLSHNPYR